MHTSTSLSIKVIHAPDARLRIKTKPVRKITPALLQTLKEMIKLTQTFNDPASTRRLRRGGPACMVQSKSLLQNPDNAKKDGRSTAKNLWL